MNPSKSQSKKCPDPKWWRRLAVQKVTPEQEAKLTRHLDKCAGCRAALEQLETLSGLGLGQTQRVASPNLSRRLAEIKRGDSIASHTRGYTDVMPWLNEHSEKIGVIHEFELDRFLGRGGMGVVFQGRDTKLDRTVAVKIMSPALMIDAVASQRFQREAQTAARINHPNVVTIYSVNEMEGLPYLVMEMVKGESLEEIIADGPILGAEQIIEISRQAAEGLSAAHQSGVLHRDIKPANIMLEQETGQVKLTDFGLACSTEGTSLTQTGSVIGTPEFIAPEQIQGAAQVDGRSDLFSLGVVMYQMCAGQVPFSGPSLMATLNQVCSAEPQSLEHLNSEIPHWLRLIVERLLQKNPDDRYGDAKQLATSLQKQQALADDQPIFLKTTRASTPKKSKDLTFIWIGLGIALAGLVAVIGWNEWNRGAEEQAHHISSTESESPRQNHLEGADHQVAKDGTGDETDEDDDANPNQILVTNQEELEEILGEHSNDITIVVDSSRRFEFRSTAFEDQTVTIRAAEGRNPIFAFALNRPWAIKMVQSNLSLSGITLEVDSLALAEDVEAFISADESKLVLRHCCLRHCEEINGLRLATSDCHLDNSLIVSNETAIEWEPKQENWLRIEGCLLAAEQNLQIIARNESEVSISNSTFFGSTNFILDLDFESDATTRIAANHCVFEANSALFHADAHPEYSEFRLLDFRKHGLIDWTGTNNILPSSVLDLFTEEDEIEPEKFSARNWKLFAKETKPESYPLTVEHRLEYEEIMAFIEENDFAVEILEPINDLDDRGVDFQTLGPEE